MVEVSNHFYVTVSTVQVAEGYNMAMNSPKPEGAAQGQGLSCRG